MLLCTWNIFGYFYFYFVSQKKKKREGRKHDQGLQGQNLEV